MATFGINVGDPGACVYALDLMLTNAQNLGLARSQFDRIVHSDNGRFTILADDLARGAGKLLAEVLAAGPILQYDASTKQGTIYSIDEFIEKIALIPKHDCSARDGLMVTLGAGHGQIDVRDWYRELAGMGCGDIRVAALKEGEHNLKFVFDIRTSPKSFRPPTPWIGEDGATALAYYRNTALSRMPVFVEFGYGHPIEDFPGLYSQTSSAPMLVAAAHPDEPRPITDLDHQHPYWIKLDIDEWGRGFTLPKPDIGVRFDASAQKVDIGMAASGPSAGLQIEVVDDALASSSSSSVEHKIAWHKHAITKLSENRQQHEDLRFSEVFLAFCFDQPPDGEANRLPLSLSRFLDRPYSQLGDMLYGFFEFPDGSGRHVIVDQKPSGFDRTITEPADAIYLSPAKWWKSGLHMFLRAGLAMRPKLDDPDFIAKVRGHLNAVSGSDDKSPILIDRFGEQKAEAFRLGNMRSLLSSDILRLLHMQFDISPHDFHALAEKHLKELRAQEAVGLDGLGASLEDGIEEAMAHRINHAQSVWVKTDQDVTALETRLTASEADIEDMNSGLDTVPGDWLEFLDNVALTQEMLVKAPRAARHQYQAGVEKCAKITDLRDETVRSAHDRLLEDQTAQETRLAQIEKREAELRASEEKVRETTDKIVAEEEKLMSGIEDVKASAEQALKRQALAITAVSKREKEMEKALRAAEVKGKALAVREAKLSELELKLAERLEQLEARKAAYDTRREDAEENTKKLNASKAEAQAGNEQPQALRGAGDE